MKILEYTLRFDTPAFLGNAEQNAQWRTPPIKALLRQWWRVAYAAEKGFKVDPAAMRREEGLLFGNAWLENDYCKSRVRLRLERWNTGGLTQWPGPEATVHHPEVGHHGANVGSTLYLGYGPLRFQGGHTTLKANAAIQTGWTTGRTIRGENSPVSRSEGHVSRRSSSPQAQPPLHVGDQLEIPIVMQ